MRTPLGQFVPQLIASFHRNDFTASSLGSFLKNPVLDAAYRGEPGAVLHRLQHDRGPLSTLIAFFILHRPTALTELADVLGEEIARGMIATGVAGSVGATPGGIGSPASTADATEAGEAEEPGPQDLVVPMLDVRPVIIDDEDRWVFSDRDASMVYGHVPSENHVLGVGAASLSLLATTPRSHVRSVLDLGTGSGVQALSQLRSADSVTATDFYGRALDLAEATLEGALTDSVARDNPDLAAPARLELLEGSWFEPVKGRKFDRIVSNPPFVVGTGEVFHGYRDSGLDLDGATELVVRGVCEHLVEGGTAHILGAWVHQDEGNGWSHRIASWLPDTGVSAWVLQRDVVDPELYVGTWLKDESIDPRSPEGIERTESWLSHFRQHDVRGIGFGYIAIQKIGDDMGTDIVAEDLAHQIDDDLGDEFEEYFQRNRWLRNKTHDVLLDSRFQLRPGVALENVSLPDQVSGMGFSRAVLRLTRTEGPRFSHEIDEHLLSIISGLHPQGLTLGDVTELYAMSSGFEPDELLTLVPSRIADLVRHGLLLPASLVDA